MADITYVTTREKECVKMSDLRTAIIQKQIEQHYPNARIVSYQDEDSGLKFYTETQLQNLKEDWFPLSCHKDPRSGKLVYGGREDVAHTYTIGETGAGKTTRFVMQSIRALSSTLHKPSFLITDLHGEIIENLYTHLKENGYTIKILNCDEPSRSDTYNPFATMVEASRQSGMIDDETHNMIRKIAEIMQPVQSMHDPIWDIGARSYTHGCILDKFEALLDGMIPPKCITLYNLIENHYWLRRQFGEFSYLNSVPYFAAKPRNAMSIQKIIAVTDNADRTRRSYWGVIENHYDIFGQTSLYQLSSCSTIHVEEFLEKPTAIIVQSGSSTCGDHLVSLLVNDIYNTIVRKGKKQRNKQLERPVHCFLDEFANCNVAEGSVFVKMLTTSRKFGMHWHMLLQSDAQMESKYDRNIGSIIRANCTEIFLGSYDYDTASRFAQSCGKTTMESLATRTTKQAPVLETTDLITADKLNLMDPGTAYIRSRRHPLLHSYYEAFYNCGEYIPLEDIDSVYPHNNFDYRPTAFFPDSISTATPKELNILNHIQQCGSCTETELTAIMPLMDVKQCLRTLQTAKLVLNTNGRITLNISLWHLAFLNQKAQKGKMSASMSGESKTENAYPQEDPWMPSDTPSHIGNSSAFDSADKVFSMDALIMMPVRNPQKMEMVQQFTCIPAAIAEHMLEIATGKDPKYMNCSFGNWKIL